MMISTGGDGNDDDASLLIPYGMQAVGRAELDTD